MLLYRREKLSGEVFHETQENFCSRSGGGDAAVVCGMREQGHSGRLFRACGRADDRGANHRASDERGRQSRQAEKRRLGLRR